MFVALTMLYAAHLDNLSKRIKGLDIFTENISLRFIVYEKDKI